MMKTLLFYLLSSFFLLIHAQVGINTDDPTSTLTVAGSLSTPSTLVASSGTIDLDETHHTAFGNNVTFNLPALSSAEGREYVLKAGGGNPCTVNPNGGDFLNGANAAYIINRDEGIVLKATSVEWIITSRITLTLTLPTRTVTSDSVINDGDYSVFLDNSTDNAADVTLPSAVGKTGRIYVIRNINSDPNSQDIIPDGSELIDGLSAYPVSNLGTRAVTIQSDGANWWVVASDN